MLRPVRLDESKGILKIGFIKNYLKTLGQGTNSLKNLRVLEHPEISYYAKEKRQKKKQCLKFSKMFSQI